MLKTPLQAVALLVEVFVGPVVYLWSASKKGATASKEGVSVRNSQGVVIAPSLYFTDCR
jgi:hypothetical protein